MGLYSISFYFTLYMLREYKPKKREDPGPYPILGFELIFSVFLSGFPVYYSGFSAFFALQFFLSFTFSSGLYFQLLFSFL
jgi:hypothetical protein